MKQDDDPARAPGSRGVWLCVIVFALADFLLINQAWFFDDAQLMVALSIPLSQCSLLAIWAATSGARLYLRFTVPMIGAPACWYVLTSILPWGTGEAASSAWALGIVVQMLVIVLLVVLYQRLMGRGTHRFAISLWALFLWTTVAALLFGFIQYGKTVWSWDMRVTDWEYFEAVPIIGAHHGLLAVLCLWALLPRHSTRMVARILIVVAMIGATTVGLHYLSSWVVATEVSSVPELLVLAFAQAITISLAIAFTLLLPRPAARQTESMTT